MSKEYEKRSSVRLDSSAAVYIESIEGQQRTWDTSSTHEESREKSIASQDRIVGYLMSARNREEDDIDDV